MGQRASDVLEDNYDESLNRCGAYLNRILGLYHFSVQNYAASIPYLEAYYQDFESSVEVMEKMAAAYLITGDKDNADTYSQQLIELRKTEGERVKELADFFIAHNLISDAEVLLKMKGKQIKVPNAK